MPVTRSFNVAIRHLLAPSLICPPRPAKFHAHYNLRHVIGAASITQSPPMPAPHPRPAARNLSLLRLTRTLEERLTALYRQSKVIGGLFRSLGRGESSDRRTPCPEARTRHPLALIRNLGSMLVMGAERLRSCASNGQSDGPRAARAERPLQRSREGLPRPDLASRHMVPVMPGSH